MPDELLTQRLGDIGEETVVDHLIGLLPSDSTLVVGPGDDCAVVPLECGLWQLLKTDCLVEGIHFLPGTAPELVGRKAINRVISDIAAMGGHPHDALVTLAVDPDRSLGELDGWYRGMVGACEAVGCRIVGGETSRLPGRGAVISVAMTGLVSPAHCILRSGAAKGDLIAVTGRLGGSFGSSRHLSFTPRLGEARWLVENARPSAMMDLSDGLGSDLPRLARASGGGYRVELTSIPCHPGVSVEQAITEGEDYELLLTFPPAVFATLSGRWKAAFPDTAITAIGEITGETGEPLPRGWEHYRHE
jgi:thiamine-monophosphate kinase